MGRSVDNLVAVVLEESDIPLHYSEIHKRVLKITDRNIDVRLVHNSVTANHTYSIARIFQKSRGIPSCIRSYVTICIFWINGTPSWRIR